MAKKKVKSKEAARKKVKAAKHIPVATVPKHHHLNRAASKRQVCRTCEITESFGCPFCTWPGLVLIAAAVVLIAMQHPTAKYVAWLFLIAAILSPWLIKLAKRHHG